MTAHPSAPQLQANAQATQAPTRPADSGCRCIRCDYNLTGLTSDRCPECGWVIDWEKARSRNEAMRIGTPVHRARRWRKLDQTLVTLAMMLFLPWRFARQLRADESIIPSLAVALISFAMLWIPDGGDYAWMLIYVAAVGTVIAGQTVLFGSLHFDPGTAYGLRWLQRIRLWLLFSLYSTCFVGTWRLVGEPPLVEDLTHANFFPFISPQWFGGEKLSVSVIYYWWVLILTVFVAVRSRPRYLAFLVPPVLYLLSWLATQVGVFTGDSLGIK